MLVTAGINPTSGAIKLLQTNLDQLKTLILIKGEEKRVGRFLPSFISITLTFPIYFFPIYSIVPPNLPTLVRYH